jgi:hypothetical protein
LEPSLNITDPVAGPFDCGDQVWPVREEVLAGFLHNMGTARLVGGVANKGWAARRTHAPSLMVRDKQDIPEDRRFDHQLCCSALHHGLCVTRDQAIYTAATTLATSIVNACGRDVLYKFIVFEDRYPALAPSSAEAAAPQQQEHHTHRSSSTSSVAVAPSHHQQSSSMTSFTPGGGAALAAATAAPTTALAATCQISISGKLVVRSQPASCRRA